VLHHVRSLGGIALIAAGCLSAADLARSSKEFTLTVENADGLSGLPVAVVRSAGSAKARRVELANHTVAVQDIRFLPNGRAVVQGRLRTTGRDDVLTILDLQTATIVDTVWTRDLAISPDGRYAAYEFRTPNSSPAGMEASLIVYDLSASPLSNSMHAGDVEDSETRGVVLYPDENRLAGKYWTIRPGQDACKRPFRSFVSPIAWAPDSKRFAVVEQEKTEERLVVVDLSQGIRAPSLIRVRVPREPFLEDRFKQNLAPEYAGTYPSFKEARFEATGKSVLLRSWAMGPFIEQTVTLTLPDSQK
jgi:hypothetical protein